MVAAAKAQSMGDPQTTNYSNLLGNDEGREKRGAHMLSDQVIRENPANRGTETSAEVLVGM